MSASFRTFTFQCNSKLCSLYSRVESGLLNALILIFNHCNKVSLWYLILFKSNLAVSTLSYELLSSRAAKRKTVVCLSCSYEDHFYRAIHTFTFSESKIIFNSCNMCFTYLHLDNSDCSIYWPTNAISKLQYNTNHRTILNKYHPYMFQHRSDIFRESTNTNFHKFNTTWTCVPSCS